MRLLECYNPTGVNDLALYRQVMYTFFNTSIDEYVLIYLKNRCFDYFEQKQKIYP